MADIRLAKPAAGASESVQCAPDARFVFDFPTSDATLARDGDNLNISFQDGSQLQLQGFYQEYNGDNLPSFNIDGTEVAAADFFQAMNEPDLMPAAGPGTGTVANGARFHEWGDSALTGGLLHLDGLDWGFSRAFEWDDVPNAVGRNGDDWGLLYSRGDGGSAPANNPVTLTPENPGSVPPGTVVPGEDPENPTPPTPGNHGIVPPGDVRLVSEAGLRDHDSVSVNGAMRVGAPDGLASIEVAGRVIWQNGHMLGNPQFATDEGYFHNFAYDAATGRLTYTYTLTDATTEHKLPGADHIAHSLPLTVRDVDGDSASSNITIIIRDDVAASTADTNTLTEGEQTEVTGNLLANDTAGADGWMAGSLTLTDAAGNALDATVEGTYGTLTIQPDGSYTYTLKDEYKGEDGKAKLPHDVQDEVFHYQVKDADGDVTSNTLTIDLVNVPLKPTGTDNPSDSDITATSIEFTLKDVDAADDDVASQTQTADLFNGPQDVTKVVFATDQDITVKGAANNSFTWKGQGTDRLTGTNGDGVTVTVTIGKVNADGTVEMTATMNDPAVHAEGKDPISITGIAVTGTDAGGSTATNKNVSITIEDDTPLAKADSGRISEGVTEPLVGNVVENDGFGADVPVTTTVEWIDSADKANYGTITLNADGSYSYTLDNNNAKVKELTGKTEAGGTVRQLTETFRYKIIDADGDESMATLTITIDGINEVVTLGTGPSVDGAVLTTREHDLTGAEDANADALTQSGSMPVSAPDGIKSIMVGGEEVKTDGSKTTIDIEGNTLTLWYKGTATEGDLHYSFTLAQATQKHDQNGRDMFSSPAFKVVVTDKDDDTAETTLTVRIEDDTPSAAPDIAPLTEGELTTVSGNVLDNDTKGADGWMDGSVKLTDESGKVLDSMTVEGQYGNLTIDGDGTYTYTLKDKYINDGLPHDVEDEVFYYQVTDADGDVTNATLTIDLVNKPLEQGEDFPAEGKSIEFMLRDAAAKAGEASDEKAALELFKPGAQDIDDVVFASEQEALKDITVEGAEGTYEWIVSADGKTLTGTNGDATVTVTIGEVKPDGTVSMKATMNAPAGHDEDSNSINITGIQVTGTDTGGSSVTANASITIADDTPQTPTFEVASSVLSSDYYASASFVGDFSSNIPDDAYARPADNVHGWTMKYSDYYMGGGANGNAAKGSYVGVVHGIEFLPTSAEYTFDKDGNLLSVKDTTNHPADFKDKNFYLTNEGLTVGSNKAGMNSGYKQDKYVWDDDEVGLAPTGNSASTVRAEAIMIEPPTSTVAYGVKIDLGHIEPGDRILLTFYLTPKNSDDNNIVKTEILEPTDKQIENGAFSTTIPVPDGFTKLFVSPMPSVPSADGTTHTSGFTLQGVAFSRPVYETSGSKPLVDYGADGPADSDALVWNFDAIGDANGWAEVPGAADGVTKYSTHVTIEGGLGKGDYGLEISIDKNGFMKGTLKDGPKGGLANDSVLFEGHFYADGSWKFDQHYNFVFKGGAKEILATLTATDADGDSITNTLHIELTETPLERFDKVSTGYYDFDKWLSFEDRDTATDFMAGENINDLIYAKGGNDVVSGDGGSAAFQAILGANGLNLDSATQNAILNNVNKPTAPIQNDKYETVKAEDTMWQNAGKVYDAIEKDATGFAAKLDALEGQHKDWNGNDTIYGGLGKDVLLGWGGSDYLEGDAGKDFLFAGGGDDIIIYDAEDAYIDGGKGFDILLANKGTGSLSSLTNAHRVEMLIRSEREDDVKSLSINTLASLEMYGITITAAGTVLLEGNWHQVGNKWVYEDGDGPLLSLEVADSVKAELVEPASQADVEAVALADDASAPYLGEEAITDTTLDADGSGPRLFAMRQSASADEDEGDAGHIASAPAAGGSAAAGKSVIEGHEDEPNTLFGTDGDDVIIGGSASDFIDGGAGSDTIYAGAGDDLIVYDPTDYLIDGGEGIDFLLAGDAQASLGQLLNEGNGENGMPIVNNVEVLLKGVDTASLTSMDKLAEKFGLTLEKGPDGQDRLVVDTDQWTKGDTADGVTTWTNTADSSITMETTLQQTSEAEGQAVLTAKVAAETGGNN